MALIPRLALLPGFSPKVRWLRALSSFVALLLSLSACAENENFKVLAREEHDPTIFTQGFAMDEGWFYESSGHYGRSFLLRYPDGSEKTGEAERPAASTSPQRLDLSRNIFAEGLEVVGDRVYLLSWQAGKAWALDKHSLQLLEEFHYAGEGWGLTHTGTSFVLSDGSNRLRFYNEEFELLASVAVHHKGRAVERINELEFHDGFIWANQWHSNLIYAIDPQTGEVKHTVDLSELHKASASRSRESVLNGIAYDAVREGFWVTGKYWKHRYLLRFSFPPQ